MARQQDQAPGRQRLLGLASVAALCAATAFAFGRVFVGRAPMGGLIVAALGSVLVAALLERRGLFLATIASFAGLVLALTWVVFPQTAWYGLPSLRTLRAIGRSLEFVSQQAKVQVAPTPPLPPLMLAALTAVWTSSFSTHALAIRAGSPLLSILPSVALVGFADTVLEDGARPIYAIVFLTAVLAVVFSDGLRRVRQWGPMWTASRRRPLWSSSVRGVRQVAAIAVLAAVLIPGLLPGFRSKAIVDFSTDGGDGIDLDPFVSILAQLDEDTPRDLFQVTTAGGAAYWRLYALDEFDGTTWTSSDPLANERGVVLSTPAQLPSTTAIPEDAPRLSQTVRFLTDVDDPWLPMAYPAEQVTVPLESIRYDEVLGQVLLDGGPDEGLEYSVSSRVVVPTPDELDAVRFLSPAQYGRYTFVTGSVSPEVGELASEWAAEAVTPYRQVLAIQDRFLDGSFFYTLDVEPASDADALLQFLTTSRRGFCQQFATAMAILVRELGYPARVAVGFRPGTEREGHYLVQTKEAHAWVEVFFPGYGWLPFEPTPGRINPVAEPGTYLNPALPAGSEGSEGLGQPNENGLGGGGAGAECLGPDGGTLNGQLCNAETRPERGGLGDGLPPGLLDGPAAAPEEDGYSIPYGLILLGLLVAAALLLLVVPPVKWSWRRRELRRSRDPRERVLAAYRVFDGEAADLGLGRRDGETLEEHRARLAAAAAFSDGHLGRLTTAAARAAYAAEPPSAGEADTASGDARRAIRDLRRDAGFVRRIVGTYRPGF